MPRRRVHKATWAALALVGGGVLLGPACLDPTEVTLSVTTDEPCSVPELQGTQIVVGAQAALASGTPTPAAQTMMCTDPGAGQDKTIGTFVVTPSGDKSASFLVEVVLGVGRKVEDCAQNGYDACIVARRRIAFTPHTRINVPITLRSVCLGVVCPPGFACNEQGTCSSDQCADPSCTTFVDAGVVDAVVAPPDAGRDATADGAVSDAGTLDGPGQDSAMDATTQDGGPGEGGGDVGSDTGGTCLRDPTYHCGDMGTCNEMTVGGCCGPIATPICSPSCTPLDAGVGVYLKCLTTLNCPTGQHCCATITSTSLSTSCSPSPCPTAQPELCSPGCGICVVGQNCTKVMSCPPWLIMSACVSTTALACP